MEISKLSNIIEEIWIEEIKSDYKNHFIFNEETLKMHFCHHLMKRINDFFLIQNHIRIIPELQFKKKRVDIAIVKVKEKREEFFHYTEFVEELIAFIELKYIPLRHYALNQMRLRKDFMSIINDLIKLEEYGKVNNKALLVGAFIDEHFYIFKNGLNNLMSISESINREILVRLIELNGFNYDKTGEFITTVNKECSI